MEVSSAFLFYGFILLSLSFVAVYYVEKIKVPTKSEDQEDLDNL